MSASHGAGDEFSYVIDARRDRTYLVTADQRGLDLVLTVEAPDGTTRSFDSPLLRDEREFVLLERTSEGPYVLTLHSEEYTGAEGGHRIQLEDLTAADRAEVEAWRFMSRGARENFEAGEEGWAAAIAAYEAAAERWHAAGRDRERAQALFAAGTIEFWQRYDWDRSSELARVSSRLYGELDSPALAAAAMYLEAMALVEKALEATSAESSAADASAELFDRVFALLSRAADRHEQLGNVYELGLIENIRGYTEHSRGNLERARAHYGQAAALMQNGDEWTAELNPLSNLAVLDTDAGNVASAIDAFERIIEILPPGKLRRYRADTLYNVGASHRLFGNIEQSLQAFSSALDIQQEIDDLQGRGRSLRGIGETYFVAGDLDLATQHLEQALPIARRTNDGRQQEGILRILGNVAYLRGDNQAALERHQQALDLAASSVDRAYLQLLIAKDLRALNRRGEAKAIALQALSTAESAGSELLLANALHEVGRTRLSDEPDAAISNIQAAAATFDSLNLQGQHADALHSLALAASEQGRLRQAVAYGESALAELEDLRIRVAAPELRAYFSGSRREYYETQIELLMRLSGEPGADSEPFVRAALATSERSRARMVADLLQEASVDLRYGVDPNLEARRSRLYEELSERSHQRDKLLEQELGPEETRERLAPILAELASVENRLNLLDIEFRRESPRFAELAAASTLDVSSMQAALDENSVLVQYALGDERSYVWVVTNETVAVEKLADRETIEGAARRLLESLSGPVSSGNPRILNEASKTLAERVLWPVSKQLEKRRIVLALDGALQYVPFSILPVGRAGETETPLIEAHEVVDVMSMSTLVTQRARERRARPDKTLAVIADPVFELSDPRFGETSGAGAAQVPSAADGLAARSPLDEELRRLPSSGWEAQAISALVPEQALFYAGGFDASRQTVLNANLDEFRFLHFATHGLVDSRYPGLSALALSSFSEHGSPREPYIRLHDIYNLELNADLVVLSACETALGREIRGEGLVGLTQGFLYAGTRGIIASLWQVPDRATAELMSRFYAFMLRDGLRPAEALRQAQLSIAADTRWSSPYYWGGFVLMGDWL